MPRMRPEMVVAPGRRPVCLSASYARCSQSRSRSQRCDTVVKSHTLRRRAPVLGNGAAPTITGSNPVAFEAGPRWFLAGALVAGAWHRSPRDLPDERRPVARASAGEDGPARHRAAQAGLPRLAARRAGSLQHGRDPDARGGGRQAPEPGAGEPGRRAHPHHQPDEGLPGAPGIRSFRPTLRMAPGLLETLRTLEGVALPPNTLAGCRATRGCAS